MSENYDLSNLTEEQQAALKELLYKKYGAKDVDDAAQFVIPFIATNDGHTPAQLKAVNNGIYKDIQRSPFLRKTGTFTEDGRIEDIDISPLVYYGTLQQSKIAPTLENVDIKLYYREPALKKVPNNNDSTDFADKYIWRELPVGFHVYNNDTVYGYEWIILQDEYTGVDGIYNLHMNIEDGIGVCKFAGTQAPINLAGVQYKIIITAKNLWTREFSLLDTMPLLHSMKTSSDELAPTVNAIRDYYAEALDTAKVVAKTLFVPTEAAPVLLADENKVTITDLSLGDVEDVETYIVSTREDFEGHINKTVADAVYDENGELAGPHGIINEGIKGNISAKSLDGLTLSNGKQAVAENLSPDYAYIPYVASDNSIGLGTVINIYNKSAKIDPTLYYSRVFEANTNKKLLTISDVSGQKDLTSLLYSLSIGTNIFDVKLFSSASVPTIQLRSGNSATDLVTLDVPKITTEQITFGSSSFSITASDVQTWKGSSSIAYKNPISEKIGVKTTGIGDTLAPNIKTDADGNEVSDLDMSQFEQRALEVAAKEFKDGNFAAKTGFDKLGSALQALYELPLGTYEYKRGQEQYKEQIGIFVERVNQFRDKLAELKGSADLANGLPANDNVLVHKKVSSIQSSNSNVIDKAEGYGTSDNQANQGSKFNTRVANNVYTYTNDEITSIAHYLDLMTSKKELAQEIRNTVGILLIAAKETQERLLDVETSIYGFDAPTLPGGDEARKTFIDNQVDSRLQSALNNSPLLLGLNRLIRAICLEIYDTTDLEKIDGEIKSVVNDSDTLANKVTVKSRMDQIDEIVSDIQNQTSALQQYYIENIKNDESSHDYTDIYSFDQKIQRITSSTAESETATLINNLSDDHAETKDVDKGRDWKNLPSENDVTTTTKNAVPFATVASSAHKHTPNKAEAGVIRVPETETVTHVDYDSNGKATTRTWEKFKLAKDDETGTYKPLYKSKAVAWNDAKLKRLNTKLSEVTKTVYGTDDVTASLPNRTEVMRRNITNLVDDLYPNRSFDIEKKVTTTDSTADIRTPFKKSNKQLTSAVTTSMTDEPSVTESHTSIIPYFDKELFNFSFTSNIFKKSSTLLTAAKFNPTYELLSTDNANYFSNHQITVNTTTGVLNFDTSKLITDQEIPSKLDKNTYGTYVNAYSRLDLLENLIGLQNSYPTNLFKSTIYQAVGFTKNNVDALYVLPDGRSSDTNYGSSRPLLCSYIDELSYIVNSSDIISNGTAAKYASSSNGLSDNIQDVTLIEYVLTRKQKPLQDRISTLESFADEISKGLQNILTKRDITSYESESELQKALIAPKRFESQSAYNTLMYISGLLMDTYRENIIFDLDLSESYKSSTNKSLDYFDHNQDVWKVIRYSDNVQKTPFVLNDGKFASNVYGYYEITGRLITDLSHLGFIETAAGSEKTGEDREYVVPKKFKLYQNWKVAVLYRTNDISLSLSETAYNEYIQLRAKQPSDLENLYTTNAYSSASATQDNINNILKTDDNGAQLGWQNQTEYNIYKTMSNAFTSLLTKDTKVEKGKENNNLFYTMMLLAHPVGSIYQSLVSTSPANLFGGTWQRLQDGQFLRSCTDADTVNTLGNVKTTSSDGGSDTISIGANQLPAHSHYYTPAGTVSTKTTVNFPQHTHVVPVGSTKTNSVTATIPAMSHHVNVIGEATTTLDKVLVSPESDLAGASTYTWNHILNNSDHEFTVNTATAKASSSVSVTVANHPAQDITIPESSVLFGNIISQKNDTASGIFDGSSSFSGTRKETEETGQKNISIDIKPKYINVYTWIRTR